MEAKQQKNVTGTKKKKTQFLYFILPRPRNDDSRNICYICSLPYGRSPGGVSASDPLEKGV